MHRTNRYKNDKIRQNSSSRIHRAFNLRFYLKILIKMELHRTTKDSRIYTFDTIADAYIFSGLFGGVLNKEERTVTI